MQLHDLNHQKKEGDIFYNNFFFIFETQNNRRNGKKLEVVWENPFKCENNKGTFSKTKPSDHKGTIKILFVWIRKYESLLKQCECNGTFQCHTVWNFQNFLLFRFYVIQNSNLAVRFLILVFETHKCQKNAKITTLCSSRNLSSSLTFTVYTWKRLLLPNTAWEEKRALVPEKCFFKRENNKKKWIWL